MSKRLHIGTVRRTIYIIISAATATFLLLMFFMGSSRVAVPESATQKVDVVQTVNDASPVYGLPVRLIIPKISVDARVSLMGLTSSGNMEAPSTNQDAGWYKYGPHPGNTGSAVIAGHLGVGSKAVFTDLSLLEKGDTVSIKDDRGRTTSFVVRETRTYAYDTEPSEVFRSTTGVHLNLITCNGDYNIGQQTYSERLVVFTDRM